MKKLISILKEVILWFIQATFWIIACYVGIYIEFGKNVADFTVGNIIMVPILFMGIGTALILKPKKGVKKISKIKYILASLFMVFLIFFLVLIQLIAYELI